MCPLDVNGRSRRSQRFFKISLHQRGAGPQHQKQCDRNHHPPLTSKGSVDDSDQHRACAQHQSKARLAQAQETQERSQRWLWGHRLGPVGLERSPSSHDRECHERSHAKNGDDNMH